MPFQKYFQKKITGANRVDHKGNNRLFKITLEDGKKYLLKQYSKTHMNDWQRGKKEFHALSFLREQNFNEIPEALRFYSEDHIGIYSFENGKTISQRDVTEKDMIHAADFLSKVHKLETRYKTKFSPASSACFSFADYLGVLDSRFDMIKDYNGSGSFEKKVKSFLNEEVKQKIKKVKSDLVKKIKKSELEKALSLEKQVLTPADFGFHNILLDEGKYKFVDFEYFGRDDPARQILDFYHHAKSADISPKLKDKFVEEYIYKMGFKEDFKDRLHLLNPLISLTWVLIYLNILAPKQLKHLQFAQGDTQSLVQERLINAKKKLKETLEI